MRKKIIAGNWKMNILPSQAAALAAEVAGIAKECANVEVVVCTPFVNLCHAAEASRECAGVLGVGAQNLHFEQSGAYTGEISANMLKDAGVGYVIIGHSERRQYFGEMDELVNKKAHAAIAAGIVPIICVGETLDQREKGITDDLIRMQTKIALLGLSGEQVSSVVIAYEPVWAIGTGKTATKEQANEVCAVIRNVVLQLHGKAAADAVRVQYGGSMNAQNAAELLAMPDIDGGLIGGASLKAADFGVIVRAAQ